MIKYFPLLFLYCFIDQPVSFGQTGFSQFYNSPLLINPANTGRFNKSYRTGGSFRREINAQEQIFTQAAFFSDFKILESSVPAQDCFALGLSGLSEKSATEGIKNTYLSISLSYQKGLDEDGTQQLGIGFQATYAHRKLLKPDYIFESQLISWINSGYSNIDIFQLGDVNVVYTDLNAGLIYQGMINEVNHFSTGISMNHITAPKKIFQGGELNVPRQTWGHLGWEKKLRNTGKLYSALLMGYSEKSLNIFYAGVASDLSLNRNNQVTFGLWFRSSMTGGKAIVPTIGLNFLGFVLNTSYDINFNSKNPGLRSATEISLIYTGAKTRERFLEERFIRF